MRRSMAGRPRPVNRYGQRPPQLAGASCASRHPDSRAIGATRRSRVAWPLRASKGGGGLPRSCRDDESRGEPLGWASREATGQKPLASQWHPTMPTFPWSRAYRFVGSHHASCAFGTPIARAIGATRVEACRMGALLDKPAVAPGCGAPTLRLALKRRVSRGGWGRRGRRGRGIVRRGTSARSSSS
jgi:hypothetical protein